MGFLDFFTRYSKSDISSVNIDNVTPGGRDVVDALPVNEEFATDLDVGDEAFEDFGPHDNSYSENGVELKPAPNAFILRYDGLLAKSGANEVFAVIGYGDNYSWHDSEVHPMRKTGKDRYEVAFSAKEPGNMNIAFKDGLENWDNNTGENYTFIDETYTGSH